MAPRLTIMGINNMKKLMFIGTIALTSLMLAACGNSVDASKQLHQVKAENSSLKTEVKSLKAQIQAQNGDGESDAPSQNSNKTKSSNAVMGKEFVLKDSRGKKMAGITLTSVGQQWTSFVTDDDMLSDSDFNMGHPQNIVQLTFKYTNYGVEDGWSPDFTVYDGTGAEAKDTNYEDGGDDVSMGHSGTATMWYCLSLPFAKNNKVEIEYSDYIDDHEYSAKWIYQH